MLPSPDKPKPKGGLDILMAVGKPHSAPPEAPEPDAEGLSQTEQYLAPPEGFQPPDDKRRGEEFTGTFRGRMEDDGRLCVLAINEIPLKGGKPEGSPEEEAAESPEEEQAEPPLPDDDEATGRAKMNKAFGRNR